MTEVEGKHVAFWSVRCVNRKTKEMFDRKLALDVATVPEVRRAELIKLIERVRCLGFCGQSNSLFCKEEEGRSHGPGKAAAEGSHAAFVHGRTSPATSPTTTTTADIPPWTTSHQPRSKLYSTTQFKQIDCPKIAKQLIDRSPSSLRARLLLQGQQAKGQVIHFLRPTRVLHDSSSWESDKGSVIGGRKSHAATAGRANSVVW